MSQTTFITVDPAELEARHDAYWRGALAAVQVPELDADEGDAPAVAEPVSFVLPYRAAMQRYRMHVADCETCSEEPFWGDSCKRGTDLAHRAAEAMTRQETLAVWN
jgi:hypothetical protein